MSAARENRTRTRRASRKLGMIAQLNPSLPGNVKMYVGNELSKFEKALMYRFNLHPNTASVRDKLAAESAEQSGEAI